MTSRISWFVNAPAPEDIAVSNFLISSGLLAAIHRGEIAKFSHLLRIIPNNKSSIRSDAR